MTNICGDVGKISQQKRLWSWILEVVSGSERPSQVCSAPLISLFFGIKSALQGVLCGSEASPGLPSSVSQHHRFPSQALVRLFVTAGWPPLEMPTTPDTFPFCKHSALSHSLSLIFHGLVTLMFMSPSPVPDHCCFFPSSPFSCWLALK